MGCSVHVLAEANRGSGLRFGYSGFVCVPQHEGTASACMQRFRHACAGFESADAAFAAGMDEGRAILERWFAAPSATWDTLT